MLETTLNLNRGVFIFEKSFSKTKCSLLLEKVVIAQCTIIQENVHVINLISVVMSKRVTLKINEDCEVLLIDKCEGTIDLSRCTNLKSLTIRKYLFIYQNDIYNNLLSLHLENVNINTTVRLGTNIKTVKLVDVTTRWLESVHIDRNCKIMYVRNFVGSLNAPDLFVYSSKMVTKKRQLSLTK